MNVYTPEEALSHIEDVNYILVMPTDLEARQSIYKQAVLLGYPEEKLLFIHNDVNSIGLPKVKVIGRNPHTATDTASTESAMLDFADKHAFKDIILIQATSPLLKKSDLDGACRKYLEGEYDSLLSVVRQKRFIWEINNDEVLPVNYKPDKRPVGRRWKDIWWKMGHYTLQAERLCCEQNAVYLEELELMKCQKIPILR